MNYTDISREQTETYKGQVQVLIVTATPIEQEKVHSYMRPPPGYQTLVRCYTPSETYFIGIFGSYLVAHVSTEMSSEGRAGSHQTTIAGIYTWRPQAVVMPGIAFGKNEKSQKIGDILVSRAVIPYEVVRLSTWSYIPWIGKYMSPEIEPRGIHAQSGRTLFNRFKDHMGWPGPNNRSRIPIVRPGKLLAGNKLVDHKGTKNKLFQLFPDAVGGEMEGNGVSSAADHEQVEWILVKAICDWGDGKKHKQFQAEAAENAVAYCHWVLSRVNAFVGWSSLTQQDTPLSPEIGSTSSTSIKINNPHELKNIKDAFIPLARTEKVDEELVSSLELVIAELADNAFSHGKSDYVSINVTKERITVEDNGFRFDPAKIYDEIYHKNSLRGSRERGVGLQSLYDFNEAFGAKVALTYFRTIDEKNILRFSLKKDINLSRAKDKRACTIIITGDYFGRGIRRDQIIFPTDCQEIYFPLSKNIRHLSFTNDVIRKILDWKPRDSRIIVLAVKDDMRTHHIRDVYGNEVELRIISPEEFREYSDEGHEFY